MAQYQTTQTSGGIRASAQIDEGLRTHMNKVYATMSVGMLVTFAVAWAIGSNDQLLSIFRDPMTLRPNILGYVAMFAPLGMIFAFGPVMRKTSAAGARLFFYAFAALMGLSLSYIFAAYTGMSIAWGYTTKKDISGWGSFLIMGVIGLLVAMIINMFLGSPAVMFAISAIGVLIFAGLTAYDTQNIKNMYIAYLNFLNMFQFLLMFMGGQE